MQIWGFSSFQLTPPNTGCSKCLRANEISYDGKYYKTGTSNTTKKPTVATTKKPTVTTTKKPTVTTDDLEGDYYE